MSVFIFLNLSLYSISAQSQDSGDALKDELLAAKKEVIEMGPQRKVVYISEFYETYTLIIEQIFLNGELSSTNNTFELSNNKCQAVLLEQNNERFF